MEIFFELNSCPPAHEHESRFERVCRIVKRDESSVAPGGGGTRWPSTDARGSRVTPTFRRSHLGKRRKYGRGFLEVRLRGLGFTASDFTEPGTVIQLGRPPNRIDILPSIAAVEFNEAWETTVEAVLAGLPVHVISKEMLIRNKTATARLQDLADVEKLN